MTNSQPSVYGELILRKTEKKKLKKFTQFVVDVYNNAPRKKSEWQQISEREKNEMIAEDEQYFPYGHFFELQNQTNEIIGTSKITLKQLHFEFPIEKDFGIDIKEQCRLIGLEVNEIWHFGRLAINSTKSVRKGITVLKILLFNAFSVIARHENNILVAECDADVCRKLEFIGVNCIKAGLPKTYIGSATFPVIIPYEYLMKFLENTKI